jgi:hypothetical protein
MPFAALPKSAAWLHSDGRTGFEVVYFDMLDDGCAIEGWTTATERGEGRDGGQGGQTWAVHYSIRLDTSWTTRSARISGRSAAGSRLTVIEADGAGHWVVDGEVRPRLDGCLDVDLESSAMTNAFPVRRMDLAVGGRAAAPAAYVRALDLAVERLEQTYVCVTDQASKKRYDYAAPAFDFACRLVCDGAGLVLDYPGIAVRAG